ncbi:17670_t:CDS:1 [Funneliformis geosporum]|uniref:3443_t:CDS:1 n=1 Tax=Funneliformis geosporum TaxID=1117311 RepID=A0A9W4WXU7_9GLOM|nr:3443_t:CDS:1 [Funneliformis geosporum]CAI2194785.1 17670_t:CDS:1 [Funneliformis geosporum]
MNLIHNHHMVDENYQYFMSNEQSISDDVKKRIEILQHAGVDITIIRSILKEEFGDYVTCVYSDIYNFIYKLEGSGINKKELDDNEFIKILKQFKHDDKEFLYFTNINKDTNRLE